MTNDHDWDQSKEHVRAELKRLACCVDDIKTEFGDLRVQLERNHGRLRADIAALQVKSGLWGAAAGAVTVAVMIGVAVLKGCA